MRWRANGLRINARRVEVIFGCSVADVCHGSAVAPSCTMLSKVGVWTSWWSGGFVYGRRIICLRSCVEGGPILAVDGGNQELDVNNAWFCY